MALFALAHMSCAGAWAWGEVPDRLREAGHGVVAPDLPLHAGVTPAQHAEVLVSAVRRSGAGGGPVVVAGHSYGGMVAPVAAEALGAAALVVIDGFVPDDGESAFDAHPARAAARREEATRRGDGMWTPGDPPPAAPDWFGRLEPMPVSAFEAPVRLAAAPMDRWFVVCLRSDLGSQAERARSRGWRVVEVDADHALPLIDPASCARILLDVAGSVRPTG